jgi:hypothetical protein
MHSGAAIPRDVGDGPNGVGPSAGARTLHCCGQSKAVEEELQPEASVGRHFLPKRRKGQGMCPFEQGLSRWMVEKPRCGFSAERGGCAKLLFAVASLPLRSRGTSGFVQRGPANPARPGREQRYRENRVCRGDSEVPLLQVAAGSAFASSVNFAFRTSLLDWH